MEVLSLRSSASHTCFWSLHTPGKGALSLVLVGESRGKNSSSPEAALTTWPREKLWLESTAGAPSEASQHFPSVLAAPLLFIKSLTGFPEEPQNPLRGIPERRHRVLVFSPSAPCRVPCSFSLWGMVKSVFSQFRSSGCVRHTRLAQTETEMQLKLVSRDSYPSLLSLSLHSWPHPPKVSAFALELTHAKAPENVNGLHSLGARTMPEHRESQLTSTLSCWTGSVKAELGFCSIWSVESYFREGETRLQCEKLGAESRGLDPILSVLSSVEFCRITQVYFLWKGRAQPCSL